MLKINFRIYFSIKKFTTYGYFDLDKPKIAHIASYLIVPFELVARFKRISKIPGSDNNVYF